MSDPRQICKADHQSSGFPQAGSAACQPLTVWLEVSAGTMPSDDAMSHLQHAAQCGECSSLLAQANATLGLDPTPEEQSILDRLETSSTASQQRLAKRLHRRTSKSDKRPPPRHSWNLLFPALSWGAAAACIIAIAAVLLLRQPSDATLLAEAYNEQRPSQLRLPGTEPGPLASPTRGSTKQPDSTQLLRLKLRTQQSFEQEPNDPHVRQILGRIALVEHDAETARRNFEMAQALDPKLPGLNFDLASAYFELAESTGQSHNYVGPLNYADNRTQANDLNYARAIDLYSQHLQQVHGNDPVALYNRALCWERTSVLPQAIVDLEHALALEKDPHWRKEIQSRLDQLRPRSSQSSSPQQPLSAAAFLFTADDPPGFYEQYLSLAGREWLPRRGADQQIDAALEKLAVLGSRHHRDHWIEDMLVVPESDAERTADQVLAEALIASAAGNTDADLIASARAVELYRHLNDQPGYLRAAVEHLYALQRMGRADDCLSEAAALSGNSQLARYSFLNAYLQLSIGGSYDMLGNPAREHLIALGVKQSASRDHLPLHALWATDIIVYDDILLKHPGFAWEEATAALRSSETLRGASIPRFQLLYDLIGIAGDLNLIWTRAGLADAAAATVGNSLNHKVAGYAFEEQGLDELKVGNLSCARQSFHSADVLLATLGNGTAVQRYAADWTADRAQLAARANGLAAGVATLAPYEGAVRQSKALEPRVHFYTEYADLLRQSHNIDGSLQQILYAITDAERSLSAVRTPSDRTTWPQQTHKAYEVLVADLAETNPTLALRAWEWLQSAPFREGQPLPAAVSAGITTNQLGSVLPAVPMQPAGRVTLVIGRVLDHYILWSLTSDRQKPVREYILSATPGSISQRTATFFRLCTDPHSSLSDLILLGASLYTDLLAPVENTISQTNGLWLDVDSSLTALPFAALQRRGRYLGLDYTLTFLPGSWVLHRTKSVDRLPAQSLVALLEEAPLNSQPLIPSEYDESAEILRIFPAAHLESANFSREGAELAVSGSPTLRSLLSRADAIHYVGHGLNDDDALASAAANPSDPAFKLSSGLLAHTRLAVLAACQTLREREDTANDVPSFARIVMAAGAANVLATQWDVDSRMTSRLMQHFYVALAVGTPFSEALRQAQQSLKANPTSTHPYFWSGFQLVSNP